MCVGVCLMGGRLQAHVKTDVRGESVAAAVSVRRVHGDRHCMEARRDLLRHSTTPPHSTCAHHDFYLDDED
jgi:hypothetical protein